VLEDLIEQVKKLDMDEVRRKAKEQSKAAGHTHEATAARA